MLLLGVGDLRLERVGLVGDGGVVAAHDGVLKKHSWIVELIVNSDLALKHVVVKRVIELGPVHESLSRLLLEPLEVEAHRSESLLFLADLAQYYLKSGRCSS